MKKNNKTIMLVVLIAIFAINAHAQNNNSVSYNEYGTINRIGFEKGYIKSSQEFFNSILNVGNDKTFVKSDTYVDEFGGLHEKYDQYFEGIKVSGGGYVLNFLQGCIVYANGNYIPIEKADTHPLLSSHDALQNFARHENIKIESEEKCEATLLILAQKESPKAKMPTSHLVYEVSVASASKCGLVNAQNGEVEFSTSSVENFSSNATLETLYSGSQQVNTQYYNGVYHLVDSTRNAVIHVWDMHDTEYNSVKTEIVDTDNIWYKNERLSNYQYLGHDVYWGLLQVYDFLKEKYNINSFDGHGHDITAYINYGNQIDRAAWDYNSLSFRFSHYTQSFNPLVSLDIIAHEFGHAVSTYKTNWVNSSYLDTLTNEQKTEINSCNEGLSDIWGVIVESHVKGTSGRWQIGEECCDGFSYTCWRDIEHPENTNAYNKIATTYHGLRYELNSDEHIKGGLFPRWFYLLTNGGSGTNELGESYNIAGVGFDLAERLIIHALFSNNLKYTKSWSDIATALHDYAYYQMRNFSLANKVMAAWKAVGVTCVCDDIRINGDCVLCESSMFAVANVPSGHTVAWSLSGGSTSSVTLSINSNYPYYCTITRPNASEFSVILTANINDSVGTLVKSVSKTLYSHSLTFSGTWSQTGIASNQNFTPSGPPLFVRKDREVVITSPQFKGMNISHTGTTPSYFYYDGNQTVRVVLLNSNNGDRLNIHAAGGCENYTIELRVTSGSGPYASPLRLSSDDNVLEISYIKAEPVNSISGDFSDIIETSSPQEWKVSVYNAMTRQLMLSESVTTTSYSTSTSLWPHGIYIVRVKPNDEEELTEKIVIE